MMPHNRYGVILMDLNMPILNGYDTCSELRQRGVTIPIVALSGTDIHTTR
jgi:CheY-like chemotaxis protein